MPPRHEPPVPWIMIVGIGIYTVFCLSDYPALLSAPGLGELTMGDVVDMEPSLGDYRNLEVTMRKLIGLVSEVPALHTLFARLTTKARALTIAGMCGKESIRKMRNGSTLTILGTVFINPVLAFMGASLALEGAELAEKHSYGKVVVDKGIYRYLGLTRFLSGVGLLGFLQGVVWANSKK